MVAGFDTVVIVDWSARSKPSPVAPTADAIWIGVDRGAASEMHYLRTRAAALEMLIGLGQAALSNGERVLMGFDFPFAYPKGFARAVQGADDPLAFWAELDQRIEDGDDNANNRWQVARDLNGVFPGVGPFWGCPASEETPDLPAKGSLRAGHGLPERRAVEAAIPKAQPCWKLYTTGSVGSQVLMGLPRLHQLRQHFGDALSVSPFEACGTPIVLAEIYPSLIAQSVAEWQQPDEILDRAQVRILARAFRALPPERLDVMLREGDPVEGWILGLGHEAELTADIFAPPPMRNDCFALPAGVDWTPVDDALTRLRRGLQTVVGVRKAPLEEAVGGILATGLQARRAHPDRANSAVDGYGFAAGAMTAGPQTLPIVAARAAADRAVAEKVPFGSAIRILTGAPLPDGIDTVVLDEDCAIAGGMVSFQDQVRPGANTRKAGEDINPGDLVLPAGHLLRASDIALIAAAGHGAVPVFNRLRVAVLSIGDELVDPEDEGPGTVDANRPMLRAMIQSWGYELIDLGRLPDDRDSLRAALNKGASEADVIICSGGASAGDEDHVSAILRAEGHMTSWRIALKPGRPLAMAMWDGVPVFGLPGNPVAAFVCTLIFARPALSVLAGGRWLAPLAMEVPAAFSKRKKPGRNEYLRARLTPEGAVEVFASEGSGRISGLSWATGLVELGPEAQEIAPGDRVRFLPYEGFGL